MSHFLEAWRAIVDDDLRGFVDRGTEADFEIDGNTLSASWQLRGHRQEALFELDASHALRWMTGPSGDDPYATFLTSDLMADFGQLASACIATVPREPDFVPSQALIDSGSGSNRDELTPQALTGLANSAREHARGLTSLFFVKGDAGAGKTTLLREATALQAERYLAGESDFLFFYVSAQGRELSNLRDAFSGELDELRAVFPQHAVASLTRAGVLVPIVDGFDELLGTAGYSGAFSSLQSLLTELDNLGTLVVSARSAFYDIEFLGQSRGRPATTNMELTTVELRPWSDRQVRDYLLRNSNGSGEGPTIAAFEQLDPDDRELLRRPFFASQFSSFVERDGEEPDSGLLEHLIGAYISRESQKIVNANGDPVLPPDGHRHLFELAVGEMWENERRRLSGDDLRTIAELVSERFGLDADQASQLAAKVTSYAGFQPRRGRSHSQADFAFEHEVYFDYFLASSISRLIAESRFEELLRFFDRGVIPDSVLAATVASLGGSAGPAAELLRCSSGIVFENRRRNLGGLLFAYACHVGPIRDVEVKSLNFIDIACGPAGFERVVFESCSFISADLRGAVFESCEARSSNFDDIKIGADTKFEIAGLDPGLNVRNLHDQAEGDVYSPEAMADLLTRRGVPISHEESSAPVYSERAQQLIALLERVTRAYERTTILYEGDKRRHSSLFRSPQWDELRDLLISQGIINREMRESRGANVPGYRLRVNVDELMTGQGGDAVPTTATGGLWRELRRLD